MKQYLFYLSIAFLCFNCCIAQQLKPYYLPEYHIHISLPEHWDTMSYSVRFYPKYSWFLVATAPKNEAQKLECSVKIDSSSSLTTNEYDGKINVYKYFTINSNSRSPSLINDYPKTEHIYYQSNENLPKRVIHEHLGRGTIRLTDMHLIILYNDIVYHVGFTSPRRKFKKYKPLFLKIADSIYFD